MTFVLSCTKDNTLGTNTNPNAPQITEEDLDLYPDYLVDFIEDNYPDNRILEITLSQYDNHYYIYLDNGEVVVYAIGSSNNSPNEGNSENELEGENENPSNPNENSEPIRFAAIGSYGGGFFDTLQIVSSMVNSWEADFIITLGDNNYGAPTTEDFSLYVGNYYCDYIYNPDAPIADICMGKAYEAEENRFFPTIGNHDVYPAGKMEAYKDYFSLPGNEEYYDFEQGDVHFFVLNNGFAHQMPNECCEDEQYGWLQEKLANSTKTWQIVYFHISPYSTGKHGSLQGMQWPFDEWGVDVVLSGHNHIYERIQPIGNSDIVYFTNGVGGRSALKCDVFPLEHPEDFDVFCYDDKHGAMLIEANSEQMRFDFYSIGDWNNPVDSYIMRK